MLRLVISYMRVFSKVFEFAAPVACGFVATYLGRRGLKTAGRPCALDQEDGRILRSGLGDVGFDELLLIANQAKARASNG